MKGDKVTMIAFAADGEAVVGYVSTARLTALEDPDQKIAADAVYKEIRLANADFEAVEPVAEEPAAQDDPEDEEPATDTDVEAPAEPETETAQTTEPDATEAADEMLTPKDVATGTDLGDETA